MAAQQSYETINLSQIAFGPSNEEILLQILDNIVECKVDTKAPRYFVQNNKITPKFIEKVDELKNVVAKILPLVHEIPATNNKDTKGARKTIRKIAEIIY